VTLQASHAPEGSKQKNAAPRGGKIRYTGMKTTVTVWGKQYEITVYQQSKSVWIAVGDYEGQEIRVQNRSRTSVASLWQETARYRGNG
jgi:hypothetical protein